VTLIHTELIKFTAIEILWLFQKESVIIAQNMNISSSWYIVSTIKLIKVNYTLHKVKRLMIIDSEWMNCNHEQAKKWINCIDKKKQTFTYTLQCIKSEVKKTIYDQQNQRTHLVQQALNSSNFVQDIYTKGVSDDTDDDLKSINVNDMLNEPVTV